MLEPQNIEIPSVVKNELRYVSTRGVLTWSACSQLATTLGGRLPQQSEVTQRLQAFGNTPLFDKDMWWPTDEEDTWISVGNYDPSNRLGHTHTELFGVPGWNNETVFYDFRSVMAVVLPSAEGGRDCESCSLSTHLNDYNLGNYRSGWICNVCRGHHSGCRWFCYHCTNDYCLNCFPVSLNSKALLKSAPKAESFVGPFHGCNLEGNVDCEGNSFFDNFDSALAAAVSIYPLCRGISFLPDSGMFFLRSGFTLCPSRAGEVTYLLVNPDGSDDNVVSPMVESAASAVAVEDSNIFSGPFPDSYLSGYATLEGVSQFDSLDDALAAGMSIYPDCHGITFEPSSQKYTLRQGTDLTPSPSGEVSYLFLDPNGPPPPPSAAADIVEKCVAIKEEIMSPVQARFEIIRELNSVLSKAMPLIDLCAVDQPGSVASLLSACRGLIFDSIKSPMWESALQATAGNGGQFELRLSRSRARKFASSNQVDHDGRFMVFSQAFRQMHPSEC